MASSCDPIDSPKNLPNIYGYASLNTLSEVQNCQKMGRELRGSICRLVRTEIKQYENTRLSGAPKAPPQSSCDTGRIVSVLSQC